jgi:hypothetical protein
MASAASDGAGAIRLELFFMMPGELVSQPVHQRAGNE